MVSIRGVIASRRDCMVYVGYGYCFHIVWKGYTVYLCLMYPRILIDNHTSNFGPTLLHCYTGILAGLLILDMFQAVGGGGGVPRVHVPPPL